VTTSTLAKGIPTECTVCSAELLNPHEITGLCLECKLVLRNERMTIQPNAVEGKQP
jgi:hypothetical protein